MVHVIVIKRETHTHDNVIHLLFLELKSHVNIFETYGVFKDCLVKIAK